MVRKVKFKYLKETSWGNTEYKVCADLYDSFYRMCNELKAMPPYPCQFDYFDGERAPWNPDWSGFKDSQDLFRMMTEGIKDQSQIRNIKALAGADKIKGRAKFTNKVRRAEEGDDLSIDRFIRKDTKCWDQIHRVRKPTEILDIVIEMSINGCVDAEDLTKAAAAVASTILSLENKGLKTRITTVMGYHMGNKVDIAVIPIKTERMRMNYPFLLFTMSPAFERGVDFGWTCRTRKTDSMGASFNGVGKEVKEAIIRKVLENDQANIVDIETLASRASYKSMDELVRAARDMISWRE
jgi:hypothetical protein